MWFIIIVFRKLLKCKPSLISKASTDACRDVLYLCVWAITYETDLVGKAKSHMCACLRFQAVFVSASDITLSVI